MVSVIMSKASMDNQRVKNQITEGLFSLLRKKSFSEITCHDRETKKSAVYRCNSGAGRGAVAGHPPRRHGPHGGAALRRPAGRAAH